jgi:hypothetical protein
MRTTVTLDADVEALLRERMREGGLTFKEALNRVLRTALAPKRVGVDPHYRLPTYALGFRPEAGLDKALAIASQLEDEEIARKLSLRK